MWLIALLDAPQLVQTAALIAGCPLNVLAGLAISKHSVHVDGSNRLGGREVSELRTLERRLPFAPLANALQTYAQP